MTRPLSGRHPVLPSSALALRPGPMVTGTLRRIRIPLATSLALLVTGLAVASACASTAPAAPQPETRQEEIWNADGEAAQPDVMGTRLPPTPESPATAQPLPTPERPVYLLDPNFRPGSERISRILVIDPDARRTASKIYSRHSPLIEVSPDGKRIIVADTYWSQVTRGEAREVLSVFDTSQRRWVADDISASGRLKYKGFPLGEQFLFFSDDGARLYLMKYGDLDIHQTRLAALDPETLETLYEAYYPPCGRRIEVYADRWVCANTSGSIDRGFTTEIDEVDPETGAVLGHLLSVESVGATAVAMSSDRKTLYLVGRDASVVVIDMRERRVLSHERLDPGPGARLTYDAVELSPDGSHLFLGLDTDQSSAWGQIDAIAVFDTATWNRKAAIPLRDPAMHFALSADGDQLYLVSIDAQSFTIYDASTFEELAILADLGGTPARIVVPAATQD